MNDIPAQAAAVALERYPGRPEVAAEVERRAREAMTQARIRAARDGLTAATMGEALKSPDVREAEALAWLADSVAQDMPAAAPSTSRAAPRRVAPPPAAHGTETRADLRAAAVLIGDILARDADEGLSARVREEQAARHGSREQRHVRGWFLVAELVKMHARQHGWTDEMEAAAERAALMAAGDGSLPVREFPEGFTAPAESVLRWCELSDFNAWLLSRGVKPLTLPQAAEAPAPAHSASASPAARPEAVAAPAAPGAPDSASAPTVAPPEAVPDGKPEAAEARQDRRLLELRSMGADFVPHGEGWRVTWKRGALAALVKREAGRPMGTRDGVRKDLQRAVQREMKRNGRVSR